jgi:hypothetical protein
LERRIAALRSQVRRLLALHGSSWAVAGAVLAILAAGLVDWLFHLTREVRLALLLGVIGLTGWLVARFIVAPLVIRFRDLDIALRIEERWPGLQDRLATTVQFLALQGKDDREDVRGSRQLREETIRRTLAEVESVDFREVVDPRPARSAMATAAVPVAFGLLLVALAPETCSTALRRLFAPYGSAEWPKQTHLTILDPNEDGRKVALGESFRLEVGVAEGEVLPAEGTVTYRFEDGEVVTRRLGTRLGDAATGTAPRFVDRIAEVNRSFRYSVAAGDDATESRSVVAVPPPSLTDARIKITPPEYTALGVEVVEPGGGKDLPGSEFDVERLVPGTVVELEARANKPIAQAALNLLGAAPWVRPQEPASGPGREAAPAEEVPAVAPPDVTLKDGGRRLVARFVVEGSGSFEFALRDTEGFRGQQRDSVRFNIQSLPDNAPQVALEEPPGNRDVTANALVPVVIQAEDDFGLGKVWLVYSIRQGDSEPVKKDPLVLWVADGEPDAKPARKREVRLDWDLASADLGLDLKPGAVIDFHAEAVDLDTIRGPKIGRSRELQLRILEPAKVAEELEDQRRQLREEISRTLAMQTQAINPVEEARRALRQVEKLGPDDRAEVQNAETIQRQVTGRINDPSDGLRRKVERYLQDQKNLKIENPEARDQMQAVLEGLDRIREDHLVPAEQGLSRANKSLDESGGNQAGDRPKDDEAGAPKAGDDPGKAQAKEGQGAKSEAGEQPSTKGNANPEKRAQKPGSEQTPQGGQQAKGSDGQENQAGEASKGQPGQQAQGEQKPSGDQGQAGEQPQGGQQPQGGEQPEGAQKPEGAPRIKPEEEPTRAGQELARAEVEQRAISGELQKMLDRLNEFETFRGVANEAKGLLKEQQETMKATAEASEKHQLDGKKRDQISPDAKADLDNLAARQEKLSEALRQFENKMDEMGRRLADQDPLAAQALQDAAGESRRRNTSDKATQAGQQLGQNQMGNAQEGQREIKRDLEKLVDSLQNRRENDLRRLVQALKEAQKDVEKLKREQALNRLQTERAKGQQDPQKRQQELERLAKQQKQIEEQLKRQLERLRKLGVDAQRAGQQAAGKMSKASQQQEEGDADEAMEDQEQALADLEDIEEEIEENVRDAEEQLAMEQLSRVRDDLANLEKRQKELVSEVKTYDKLRVDSGALTLPQKKSVVGLGRAEEAVRDETRDLVEQLDAAPVYAETLERAAKAMTDASARLRDADPGEETRREMELASRRFEQLIAALKPDPADGGQQAQQGQNGGGGGGGGGDGIPTAAQLKMLKWLQEEINTRTEEIALVRERKAELTPEQEAELTQLRDEQGRIADLARDLTRPQRDDGEE